MKKNIFIASVISLLVLSVSLEARGGGGHGGGRGGGGGRSMQRSPSMSRSARSSPVSRPQFNNRAGAGRQAVQSANRAQPSRQQVQQFMKGRSNSGLNRNARQYDGRYNRAGNNIRNNIGSRYPDRGNWFRNNNLGYYNRNANWWAGATALGVGAWLGWNNAEPYYYDYGYDDSNYAYNPNQYNDYGTDGVMSSGTSANTPIVDASSNSAPAVNTSSDQWMPLGVFAVSNNADDNSTPNMFMQLALNKSGEIEGTFHNATTDQSYALEGSVDQNTKLAAWRIADNENSPVIQTGIYNLTQDEAPVKIYYPNASPQEGLLVRVNN